jgi:hypothetical protein
LPRCGPWRRAPGTPKGAGIVASQLTNTTTLTWPQGTDADLADYEVLWRETTSPDWTNVQAVGNVTTATIDLSKDNLFFGVRAVDTDGNSSPVAFPQPTT